MNKGFELVYWAGDEVSGDWDAAAFESRAAAEKAGWIIDEVVNGNHLGHFEAAERKTRIRV
jgi:hypothetical protein